MFFVEAGDEAPELVLTRRAVKRIQIATANMTAGIAGKTKERQQRGIDAQHNRTQTDTKAVRKTKGCQRIPPKKSEDH